ncbi:hypothetical protein BpHYR1_001861 [Brachionus plicatilis]|uniref:Uncharacterized protein n=1 Tax=Brachionus plicatilis TaxID=10195 RepID=A0A3M7PTE0_BRAPC|nr:hypothetical protein BpHYR1_001861 [Brachionus plicatilis]
MFAQTFCPHVKCYLGTDLLISISFSFFKQNSCVSCEHFFGSMFGLFSPPPLVEDNEARLFNRYSE